MYLKHRFSEYSPLLESRLWKDWFAAWPGVPSIAWMLGAHYFRTGEYRLASKFYDRGLRRRASHPAANFARLDLAYCIYRSGEHQKALEILEEITTREIPRDAFILRAELEELLGNSDASERTLRRCLEDFYPGDVRATVLLARQVFYFGCKATDTDVREMLRQLLTLRERLDINDPLFAAVDTALAQYHLSCGDINCGEKLLARALAHESCPIEASMLRGEWLLEQRRANHAIAQLSRVVERLPFHPKPLALLARAYLLEGPMRNVSWAKSLAESAARLSRWAHPTALEVLYKAYAAAGDEVAAECVFELLAQREAQHDVTTTLEDAAEASQSARNERKHGA